MEPGQPEEVCFFTVCLLKEDGCDFVGVGEVAYDVQFGGGEALDIQLEHCQALTFDGRDGRPRPDVSLRLSDLLRPGLAA